jgi:hypothetical protein
MIGKSIYTLLTNDATFAALAGLRVYPTTVPQNAVFPYAVYTVTGTNPMNQKDGVSPLDEVFIQLDMYSTSYLTSQNMGAAARLALDRYRGTVEGVAIDRCVIEGNADGDFDPDLGVYWVSQDYRFRVKLVGTVPSDAEFFRQQFTNVVDNTVTVTENSGVLPVNVAQISVFVNGSYTSDFTVTGSDIEIGFDIAATDIVTVTFFISDSIAAYAQNFTAISGTTVTVTANGGVLPADSAAITVYLNGQQTNEWTKSGSNIIFDYSLFPTDLVTVKFIIY